MKHDRSPDLSAFADSIGLDLDGAMVSRLVAFEDLLGDRAIRLGLIAASDRERIRVRHVLDSLRAAAVVRSEDGTAFDLGAGAGLPGIVVAIARPRLHVGLVEPRRTRVAFLELALERLGVANAYVLQRRIEEVDDQVDVCFARAFAPLRAAWGAAFPRLRPGGRLVYFAGPEMVGPVEPPPGAASVVLVETPVLESSGPLVIMGR